MKKLLVILLALVILTAAGLTYLNKVFLPAKIKSLIVQAVSDATQKKVSLEALEFSLVKGLVLRNLTIYEAQKPLLSIPDVSCRFLIWPIFKKQLVIPAISLNRPSIFLQRRADNSINLGELFFTPASGAQPAQPLRFIISKITITNARIDFRDDTLKPAFSKSISGFDLTAYLSLPASVKFKLKANMEAASLFLFEAQGEYRIPEEEFTGTFSFSGLAPEEFAGYYQDAGLGVINGMVDGTGKLAYKKDIVFADISLKAKGMAWVKENLSAKLDSLIQAKLDYGIKTKAFNYSGTASVSNAQIQGIENTGMIRDFIGILNFDAQKISSQDLRAQVWGVPIEARLALSGYQDPLLEMNITGKLSLTALKKILQDKFNLLLPLAPQGAGDLSLALKLAPVSGGLPELEGYLELADASVELEKLKGSPLAAIRGRIKFTLNGISWSDLSFKFRDADYVSSGAMANYLRPAIEMSVSSDALKLKADFLVADKTIGLSKFTGTYQDSACALSGNLDFSQEPVLKADISGSGEIELKDMASLLPQLKEQFAAIKPQGKLKAAFVLTGNINDIKSCALESKWASSLLSFYGLKLTDASLSVDLKDGILDIAKAQAALYEGSVQLSAKMNFTSSNLPYWISAELKGVKIEKLKLDTAVKDKELSGQVQAVVKVNGFSGDMAKLSGAGKILVTDGNLWELNLFKGLGALIFAQDFDSIVFSEASCAFTIQDQSIQTDNLKLKSNLADITGPLKIGFDGRIQSELGIDILSQAAPVTGTLKDLATAIVGGVGKFGTIVVSGTLNDPKYKFHPAVTDILKGLKNVLFGN